MVKAFDIKSDLQKTELGSFPPDWISCQFKDVLSGFSSGQTPYREIKRYYRGGIPWITSGELNHGVITDTAEKITEEAVIKTNLKIIPKGTFLFAITGLEAEGTRGRCALTGIEATTNQSCMALYPKGEITTDYLLHFYKMYSEFLALKYCQGTKQQSYTAEIAKKLPIVLPPTKKEQIAIAEALNDANRLITDLEKLIEKKRGIRQGAMQELLKPKENWIKMKMGKLYDFLATANNSRSDLIISGELEYIHYGDIHTRWINFLDCSKNYLPYIPKEKVKNVPFLEEGDLIIADASEDYEGLCACVEIKNIGNRKIIAGLHTMLLRGKKEYLVNGFKGYLRSLPGVMDSFIRVSTGVSVYSVSKNNLKEIEIDIPKPTEQREIVNILNDMDSEIEVLENKLEKCKLLKQGMMQNLLTGKIRLI